MKKYIFFAGVTSMAITMFATGCASLTERAAQGDAEAQVELSEKLFAGDSSYTQNQEQAKIWIDKAVKANYMPARIKKSEFILQGYYGDKINGNEAVALLYPAVQAKQPQAAFNLLKILIQYGDADNLDKAADCFALLVDRKYTDSDMTQAMLVLINENCAAFIDNALVMKDLSLAMQKKRIHQISKFANTGFSWTRKRLRFKFAMAKKNIEIQKERINRTAEVIGTGTTPKECKMNALREAVQTLCGVQVASEMNSANDFSEVTKTVSKANKTTAFSSTSTQDKFNEETNAKFMGRLAAFEVISAPRKRADGLYEGKYRAVRKK